MSASETVELVARAIYGDDDNWSRFPEKMRAPFHKQARRAIKAMRNAPFNPVILAMVNVTDDGRGTLHSRKWNAAIKAALKSEPKP